MAVFLDPLDGCVSKHVKTTRCVWETSVIPRTSPLCYNKIVRAYFEKKGDALWKIKIIVWHIQHGCEVSHDVQFQIL